MTVAESAGRNVADGARMLELPDHWRALVFTSGPTAAPSCGSEHANGPPQRPDADLDAWRDMLTALIRRVGDDPDGVAPSPDTEVLKHARTGRVVRTVLTGDRTRWDVVCKYDGRSRGAADRLVRASLSRHRRDWRRALALMRAGIATARPVALMYRSRRPRGSMLVVEYLADAQDLDRVVLTMLPRVPARRVRAVKSALIAPIVDMLAGLRDAGFYHRDLKASNLLVTDWDGSGGAPRVWVVDLEGLHRGVAASYRARWRPVIRLAASLASYDAVTRTDCARFLRAYLPRVGIPADQWKTHWRRLADRAAAYNRRSRRRKRDRIDGFTG